MTSGQVNWWKHIDVSHLHLQKGSLLTKGHRQLWRPTEEATQKMAMTQIAEQRGNSRQTGDSAYDHRDIHSYSTGKYSLNMWMVVWVSPPCVQYSVCWLNEQQLIEDTQRSVSSYQFDRGNDHSTRDVHRFRSVNCIYSLTMLDTEQLPRGNEGKECAVAQAACRKFTLELHGGIIK